MQILHFQTHSKLYTTHVERWSDNRTDVWNREDTWASLTQLTMDLQIQMLPSSTSSLQNHLQLSQNICWLCLRVWLIFVHFSCLLAVLIFHIKTFKDKIGFFYYFFCSGWLPVLAELQTQYSASGRLRPCIAMCTVCLPNQSGLWWACCSCPWLRDCMIILNGCRTAKHSVRRGMLMCGRWNIPV